MNPTIQVPRLFAQSLKADAIDLSTAEAHHALDVLRLQDGQVVELFDGAGEVALGRLRPAGRKSTRVEVTQRRPGRPSPAPAVELAFAVPKGRRLDWLLEKATELGAAVLAPVVFQRSVVRPGFSPHCRQRWRQVCIAAAKQCGADLLPDIEPPVPLEQYLRQARQRLRIFGDSGGDDSLAELLQKVEREDRVGVLVGPEGGLTEAERCSAVAAGLLPVRLGNYTLRVETAAIAFLSAIRACWTSGQP